MRESTPLTESLVEAKAPFHRTIRKGRTVSFLGLLTLATAAIGYLREAALAARFGVSTATDAYFAAIFIPTLLYLVMIAGTLSPVLIPILFQDNGTDDRERTSETFSVITNFVLLLVLLAVLGGMATAGIWLPLLFSGFDAATVRSAVRLTYIVFPGMIFLGIAGVLTALLNGFHRFALAACAPALASLAVIAGVVLARGTNAIYFVGVATAGGFLLQCLLLIPAAVKLGVRYRPILSLTHPAVVKLIRLGVPLILYLAVANGALFLERNLASRLSAGAVTTVTYALRLFVVPGNLLAAPLVTVFYPDFARKAAQGQYLSLRDQTSRVLRLVVFLFLPITVWVILNALPLTRVLYERGQFRLEDSVVTSRVLMFYSIGILPNAIAMVLLRSFYAVQDTMTPLLAEIADLIYYIVAATWLSRHFGLGGLAIARGGSFLLVAGILVAVAWKKRGLVALDGPLAAVTLRTAVASLLMAFVSWGSWHFLRDIFNSGATLTRALVLLTVFLLSGTAFLGAAAMLNLGEARQISRTVWDLVRRHAVA
jgi:putative peptidoglycan lipid II flippase